MVNQIDREFISKIDYFLRYRVIFDLKGGNVAKVVDFDDSGNE